MNNAFEKLLDKTDGTPPIQIKRQAQTESLSSDHRDIDDESNITAAGAGAAATQDKIVVIKKVKVEKELPSTQTVKAGKLVTECEHTDKKHYSKGMCKPCYCKDANQKSKDKAK